MPSYAVNVSKLEKMYPNRLKAVDGISFSVANGEILALWA